LRGFDRGVSIASIVTLIFRIDENFMSVNLSVPVAEPLPLLMLPGLICDSRIFAAQAEAFGQVWPVPDYGDAATLADMARRVLDAAPPRFALLGHSMGARVALEIVRSAGDRVDRLALLSTGVHLPGEGEAAKRYALRDLGRQHGMAALVDAWLPPMLAPSHASGALYEELHAMCVAAGLARFEAQIAALLLRPEVESLLPTIACPTLIAVGSEDRWSPPAQHEAIAALIPGARLAVIDGAGHMLPAEYPDALNAVLADWLEQPAISYCPEGA
jgi:pimeloyl-ACP methyl ester carboxylesterase